MKTLTRIISLLLAMMLCLSLVSCTVEEDVYKRAQKYLKKEYPSGKFTVVDYEKRNETSGRYEINARCLDDGIEFKIYMYSSIAVTDSYSVERANAMMETVLASEIGEELLKKFKYIQWNDIFADRATDYRFREVDVASSFSLADIEKIHEIKISENVSAADIGGLVYDFMYALCDDVQDNCNVKEAEFIFSVGRYTYKFKTSSKAVLGLGRDGTVYYVLMNIAKNSNAFKDVEFEYFSAEEIEEAENNTKKTRRY